MSRDTLRGAPSGLGTLWLTPAAWTMIIRAIEAATLTALSVSVKSGKTGVGKPRGISLISRTISTPPRGRKNTSNDGIAMAAILAKCPSLVRASSTARINVRTASARDRKLISVTCRSRSIACVNLLLPVAV